MNVLHINTTSHSGGAAIAALRLVKAQNKQGTKADLLVAFKEKDHANIHSAYKFSSITWLFIYLEKLLFLFFEKDKTVRFSFSTGWFGRNITKHPLVKQADIIHLHWINNGFLSLENLKQLKKLNKPIVWTLHDMWAFTGGCHHAGSCTNFKNNCGNCYYLKTNNQSDLSNKIWLKKRNYFSEIPDLTITCSHWLEGKARMSSLFKNKNIVTIPNTINVEVYKPKNKEECKHLLGITTNKKYILFGAANIKSPYKGFDLFLEIIKKLQATWPENYELLIFGKCDDESINKICVPHKYIGTVYGDENVVNVYNAAELLIFTSKEENLPNMIMESMACGTPVIAFNIGGIGDLITTETGTLVNSFDTEQFATGIRGYISDEKETQIKSQKSVAAVNAYFSQAFVAQQTVQEYLKLTL